MNATDLAKGKGPGDLAALGQKIAQSTPPTHEIDAGNGRRLSISKSPSGGVRFTAPPPPVSEITFSGGGGKGTALPGAVKALEESGILGSQTRSTEHPSAR